MNIYSEEITFSKNKIIQNLKFLKKYFYEIKKLHFKNAIFKENLTFVFRQITHKKKNSVLTSDLARIELEPENIWELENSEKEQTFDFRNFGSHVIFPRQNAWKSRFVKFQNKKLIEQLLSISGISRLPEDGLNMEIVLNEYFDLFFTRSNSDNLQKSWPLRKLEIASRDFARNSKEEKSIKTSTVFYVLAFHFSGFSALESEETKGKTKINFVAQKNFLSNLVDGPL